jgi:DNA-binding SARP family transcriptional activator/tetratricopeptide (TPR) repeat protein
LVEFGLLGPLLVRSGDTPVEVSARKQRVLLAVLLLHANQAVAAGDLASAIWQDNPPETARVTLQNYVMRLRHALGPAGYERIVSRPSGYLIEIHPGELDVARFAELQGAGLAAARSGAWEDASGQLAAALKLWRGQPLADVPCALLAVEVSKLAEMRLVALETRIDADLHLGRHQEVTADLAALATAEPLRERVHELLMLALYRSGQQAAALAAYRHARRQLVDELSIEPGPALRDLNQRILQSDPALRFQPSREDAGCVASPPGRRNAGQGLRGEPPGDSARQDSGTRQDRGAVPGTTAAFQPGTGAASAGATAAGSAVPVVPRQLPGTPAGFLGRADELAVLTAALDQAGPQTGTVVISAIGGTAGVGKTALAVHWAHQVARRFPGGQLYVNLRGFGPSGTPVTPGKAIRGFLEALGVPVDRIPPDLAAQAGLYRSVVAGRRLLIVLDNARDEQQVRPLLPAGPECMVVVTSRSQLAGLAVAEGARLLSLDLLSDAEARQMLTARLGAGRAAAEPDAVAEIAELCARLPLALAVAAARASTRPGLPLSGLAGELRDAQGRLDVLDTGDPAASVRAVFSWSAQQLSPAAARMFGLLGLHPGPDISAPAAASLAGTSQPEARRMLGELTRGCLIAEHVPGRYTFHDLLRAYAAEQAHHTGSDADRHAATGRMLDHYLHTAACAADLFNPSKEPVALAPPRPGAAAGQSADHSQALAWFEAEHQVLLAAVTVADESGFDSHAWQLPWAITSFLQARGHWQEWAATQRTALAAATRLGDAAAQALCGRLLASAYTHLGDHDQALRHYAISLTLYQRLGNRLGQAKIHMNLDAQAEREGRYADALGHAEQALRLYQAIGDKASEAEALNNVGWDHGLLGDYQRARVFCRRALTLSAEADYRWTEGDAWDSLGYAEHHLGNLAEAAACYQRALSIAREHGERRLEAETLTHMGDTHHDAGELGQAREAWQQALAILEDLHHPDADQVRAKLASTSHHASPNPSG